MLVNELLRCVKLKVRVATLIEKTSKAPSGVDIAEECLALAEMLVEKNAKYGDSALNPIRIFSKAGPIEQIKDRIDDKLNRLMKGSGDEDEDVVADLLGYLVLLRIAERRHAGSEETFPAVVAEALERAGEAAFEESVEQERVGGWWWKLENYPPSDTPRVVTPPEYGQGAPVEGARCQDCGKGSVQPNEAICDACYERRYGRIKVDLSHVQG